MKTKNKVIKTIITSCKECSYCWKPKITGTPFSYCMKETGEEFWRRPFKDVNKIQEWCPLEEDEKD